MYPLERIIATNTFSGLMCSPFCKHKLGTAVGS
jgi:hypothetical protein